MTKVPTTYPYTQVRCVDCAHHWISPGDISKNRRDHHMCRYELADLVGGDLRDHTQRIDCKENRLHGPCGYDGRFFELADNVLNHEGRYIHPHRRR